MKSLLPITLILFCTNSFANKTEDIEKMLKDSQCTVSKDPEGKQSVQCSGPLGEKLKEKKIQNFGAQKNQKIEVKSVPNSPDAETK